MLLTNLTILVLAGFVGFYVISKVPNTLHTPLMSGTNAIHGIVLLGGLLVLGLADNDTFYTVILASAAACGTMNVVAGFLVPDRRLEMFKGKKKQGEEPRSLRRSSPRRRSPGRPDSPTSSTSSPSRCSS